MQKTDKTARPRGFERPKNTINHWQLQILYCAVARFSERVSFLRPEALDDSSSSLSLSLPPQPKPSWVWPSLGWSTLNCRCGPPDKPCFQVFSGSILRTVVLPPSTAPEHLWCPPHRSCHLSRGKAECMHASIACLLLYEDYVWVSLGNAMKAKQSKATQSVCMPR